MRDDGVIEAYAIGGAVGATFYLEPLATVDVDIFVAMKPRVGQVILDPQPIFRYLDARGYAMAGEYVMISDWPVRILATAGPLMEEAMRQAEVSDVDGEPAHVFTAEHLAAICLETGRAKDKARLLQFIESGALDAGVGEVQDPVSGGCAMTFDLARIIESKRALRSRLAQLPIGEKLRMLDALRERTLAIRASARHQVPHPEPAPEDCTPADDSGGAK